MAHWLEELKAYVDTLETIIGTEGGTALADKLTAARAALLDQITALRLAELDAANMPADVDTLNAAIGAIEGATALHDKLTAARAALLDEMTAARMAELDGANLPADIDNLKEEADGVYVDPDVGVAGTAWPIGTAQNPVASLADAITICTARNLRKLYLFSRVDGTVFTAPANMQGYEIIGPERPQITFAGASKDFDGTIFKGLYLTDTFTGVLYCRDCMILATCKGYFTDCFIVDIFMNGSIALLNPEFTIDGWIDGQNLGFAFSVFGGKGDCILKNHNNGAQVCPIYGDVMKLTIDASYTAGTLNVWGGVKITNNGVGMTLNDYTVHALATTLVARLTAARAGYLDNLNNAQLLQISAARLGYIDLLADGTVGLAALEALVDGIETQTDKLAGAAPGVGSTTANWNTATGSSGEAGEDLVTIGADGVKNKVLSLDIDVSACTDGAILTLKMFKQINGVERKFYSQTYTVGTLPDGIPLISGVVGIHEALRVEVYSDTNESVAIGYDYMLEVM